MRTLNGCGLTLKYHVTSNTVLAFAWSELYDKCSVTHQSGVLGRDSRQVLESSLSRVTIVSGVVVGSLSVLWRESRTPFLVIANCPGSILRRKRMLPFSQVPESRQPRSGLTHEDIATANAVSIHG